MIRRILKAIVDSILDGIVQEYTDFMSEVRDTFTTSNIGDTSMTIIIDKTMDEIDVALAMMEAVPCLRINIRPIGDTFELKAIGRV